MKTEDAAEFQVSRSALLWVLVAQSLTILPLFFYLAPWIPAVWMAMMLWRVLIYRGRAAFPKSRVKTLIGLVCIAGLALSYGANFALEAAVAALVVGFVLKLIEMRTRKDVLVIVYICFVVIAGQLLFSQSFGASIYGLFCITITITALAAVYRRRQLGLVASYWQGSKIVLLALPGMLILFLLLPRLGPIWAVPNASQKAATGFGDTVAPGDISQLTRSNEIAFRVTFYEQGRDSGLLYVAEPDSAAVPSAQYRYWRGLVLESYDGRAWRQGNESRFNLPMRYPSDQPVPRWRLTYDIDAPIYRYDIMLEPHQRNRLFAMPAPLNMSTTRARVFFQDDLLAISSEKVSNRMQYRVDSTLLYAVSSLDLDARTRRRNVSLPQSGNPKTRELAQRWLGEGLTPPQRVERALSFFQQSFFYTLSPPALGDNAVDDFLFTTRRGFCEHFASSFVFLMRSVNVPARVVVGYQGGEFNGQEPFLTVRQSDAHAWAEVWIKNTGWIRIDPTASVAPNRIERGLSNAVTEDEATMIGSQSWLSSSNALMQRLRTAADAFGYRWHRLVLAYNPNDQRNLIERLLGGADPWRIMVAFIMTAGTVAGGLFAVMWLRERGNRPPPATRWYLRHLRQMTKAGFPREIGETPSDFAARVGQLRPQWRSQLNTIAMLFDAVNYRNQPQRSNEMRKAVKNFRPKDR